MSCSRQSAPTTTWNSFGAAAPRLRTRPRGEIPPRRSRPRPCKPDLILRILCIGHKPPAWVAAGFEEYARRMPREARIELAEIKPAPRSHQEPSAASVARMLEIEKTRFDAALAPGCVRIALDER